VVRDNRTIRIATRGSELALWQSHFVESSLRAVDSAVATEIVVVKTIGDRVQDVPLAQIGDRGLFTKEVDDAVLEGRADLAVHSLKDVPTVIQEGLEIVAVAERADPRDVLLCRPDGPESLDALASGSRVGTSSLRRRAQLMARRTDLEIVDLRGNLNTRLRRLDEGDYDAIILAAAGVLRLGWSERVSEYLDPPGWLPAVGQGALALLARTNDEETRSLVSPLSHDATFHCTAAERAFLHALEGGCQVPIAALATLDGERLHLDGLVSDLDGGQVVRDQLSGRADTAVELGQELADRLIALGAKDILRQVRMIGNAYPTPAP